MFIRSIVLIMLVLQGGASADITFEPSSPPGDVSVETLIAEGKEYHLLSVRGFDLPMVEVHNAGLPSIPFTAVTFLLPPGTAVDTIEVLSATWDTLPGNYYLYPVQLETMTDTAFTPPDSIVYNSIEPFPALPVKVSRQGSAMGYSVVTIAGTPIRYIPADSTVMILTSVTLDIRTGPSESELIVPNRETEWSTAMRERGILSLVSNPENLVCYQRPVSMSFRNRTSPLNITQSPSSEGDGVDMVIITSEELADDFEQVADYRTQQGIITVIRTVEWINQFYSGWDSPERIRNFIRDAHQEWGIQAVLIGGDNDVVPIRECNGWNYTPGPFPIYQAPSDDYYADIDGNWSYNGSMWSTVVSTNYLDLCTGRWPVVNSDDVDLFFTKLKLYEQPEEFPEDFARKLLLMSSNILDGNGADDMMELMAQLHESSAIPEYMDEPTELYYPHSLPAGDLCRSAALDEIDQGYNLIIHADHSEIHKLATAGKNALGQYIWDSDFATMSNFNEPSILWTLGCDPGHFDGANCFAEAGLLTSDSTGLVAAIANARIGIFGQKTTYYAFCDALFNTGWINQYGYQFNHWPLSYLGEANRCSKNYSSISFLHMNLLGSPLMYVWRDDPVELHLSVPLTLLREGVSSDITVTVTDGTDPVDNAIVCLWKKDEIFSIENTNAQGQLTFENVYVTDSSGDPDVVITAVKQRMEINCDETTVSNYIPDQVTLNIVPADIPIVSLEDFSVDVTGDGTANPGETVNIYLTAKNSGGETAQNVSAQLFLLSGDEYIANIDDNRSRFPDIDQDQTGDAADPFTVTVNPDIESYSTVEFGVLFSYKGSSGDYHWKSPLFLTIYSEGYDLTVMNSAADNSGKGVAEITLSDMFLANCGLGDGSNLDITVDNLFPPAFFKVNTLTHPAIESNEVAELSGSISLTVLPGISSSSAWLEKGFQGCSFDVMVSSNGGNFIARHVDVHMVYALHRFDLDPPSELRSYETGQNYISLHWEHDGNVTAEGFYIYYEGSDAQHRAYPLPVPVKQVTIEGLLPGTEFEINVTAVDSIGRESDPATVSISTSCPAVDGWPIQLAGSPGGGPAIADIDQDGSDEIIVATSFGVVYIIEKNGSYQTLYPPQGYDFDRFLGCAVGDVDGDSQLEIVVSCQKNIEIENSEQLAILLFDRSGATWIADEITATEVNEQAASPNIAGTPVLFQADNSMALEIALRTKGNNGGSPHLYAWRFDPDTDRWVYYSEDFPVNLLGCYYSAPSAVDFDNDGFEELIVTTYGSAGIGTALIIADFKTDGNVIISKHDLPELDTEGEIARTFGTLAAAEENGTYYIAGSAKSNVFCSTLKRVFVYRLDSDPAGVTFLWKTHWMNGNDSYGNMPGPAIGDLDGDSDLEVIYTLNDGEYYKEGAIHGWDLSNGTSEFQSANIPFNPITGEGGAYIKSQPVVGLTTSQGSTEMVVFAGFSTLCCGFDPGAGSSILEGFPAWTRDGSWAAPALCDLDSDGSAEVLYIDYSGYAMLFDWYEGSYTNNGWHMYQDNPFRNGFYNTGNRSGDLDISISGNPYITTRSDAQGFRLLAEVEITGCCDVPASEIPSASISASVPDPERTISSPDNGLSSSASSITLSETRNNQFDHSCFSTDIEPVANSRTLEIAAFCGNRQIGSTKIRLENGSHMVPIQLISRIHLNGDITVIADPFNTYRETDETNNISLAEISVITGISPGVVIPSPAETIELTVTLPLPLPDGVRIRVYSIDGRLVTSLDTEELYSGTTSILLSNGSGIDRLPTGMYTVCVDGLDSGTMIRKVVIINN